MDKNICGWCGVIHWGSPFKDCYPCRMKISKGCMKMQIGQLVEAKMNTGVCRVGEVGVVVEHYHIGLHEGWQIIFEHGLYDGFGSDQLHMLNILTDVNNDIAEYMFTNFMTLHADWSAGKFTASFEQAKRSIKDD